MVNTTSDMSERILRCRYSVQYTTVFQSKYWYDTGQVCYIQYGARIRLITWVRTMGVDHTHGDDHGTTGCGRVGIFFHMAPRVVGLVLSHSIKVGCFTNFYSTANCQVI